MRLIALSVTGDVDAGIFLRADLDIRIGLGVLELYIVLGRVLLDKHVFERERLDLRVADDVIEVLDETDHTRRLHRVVVTGEVGSDAILQLLGFADVDDITVGAFHYIDARCLGQGIGLVSEPFYPRHFLLLSARRR